ncbi:MAG: ice-binding family protein [Candidatus Paceibacterota bacterium]
MNKKFVVSVLSASALALGFFTAVSATVMLPIDLGTAGNFVILSKTGVTNIPTSSITGNIGTSPITGASITGLDCAEVTGSIYTVDATGPSCKITSPTLLTTAISDMETAYTEAAGKTVSSGATTDVGAGTLTDLTLTSGVYQWGSNVTIPTDLTLSGGSTDIFIFKVAGTLDIASNKNIILTGGALASNVFWQTTGTVTIGSGSHFEGVILSQTNIAMLTGATLSGRAFAKTAVTLDGNTISASDVASTGVVFIDTNVNGTRDGGELFFSTLQGAINAASPNDTLVLSSDITTISKVLVDKALTINGANYTLYANFTGSSDATNNSAIEIAHDSVTIKNLTEDGTSGTRFHGINIYKSANVVLDTVTVSHNAKSGITVNGSTVTAHNVSTLGNTWGGINVDQGSGVTLPSTLTVTGTSIHEESNSAIWIDDNSKVDVSVIDTNSQYASTTYVFSPSATGSVFSLKSRTVKNETELRSALSNALVSTIIFSQDISLAAQLDINRSVIIDGGMHTLTATFNSGSVINILANDVMIKNLIEDGTGTTANRGINIYKVTGVTLDTVTASHNSKNGIVVNGSTVVMNNISTAYNGWEAIDVDLGSGVTSPASLTVNGVSSHVENKAAIRIDDTTKATSVIDTNNQYTSTTTVNTKDFSLTVTVVKNETDLRTALNNASLATIVFGSDITIPSTSSALLVSRAVTIDGHGFTLKAQFTKTSNSNNSAIMIGHSDVTIKNLIVDGTGSTNLHGINVYTSTGVKLESVSVTHNGHAGIVVNGAEVDAKNISTSFNGWGGVNVDQGSGVTATSTLTIHGVSLHSETGAAIWIDDITKNVAVVDADAQYSFTGTTSLRTFAMNTVKVKTVTTTHQSGTSGSVAVTVDVPTGTIISGSLLWSGILDAPVATTTTVSLSGFNTSVTSAIALGSSNFDLTFDRGVRLLFAGQKNTQIGWYNHAGSFSVIATTCAADTQTAGDALASGADCKINVGNDLVVWTKHFSTFVTYTQAAFTVSGGGGGGSYFVSSPVIASNNSNTTVTPVLAVAPAGQVLGASAVRGEVLGATSFAFLKDLRFGSRGEDVNELHKFLIAGGYLNIPSPTGYFGSMTRTAVAKWQKANKVYPTMGYFGKLSRAKMMSMNGQ